MLILSACAKIESGFWNNPELEEPEVNFARVLMVVLDSDPISLMERGGAEGRRIWQRIRALPPDDVATTIVSFEEQTRGWLARIARATTTLDTSGSKARVTPICR